jgi:uncharacterized protein
MKHQVIVIHGADAYRMREEYLDFLRTFQIDFEALRSGKKGWKDGLGKTLGNDFEVIAPRMPNKENARFEEWKIWFEKLIPFLNPRVTLVGHSMGGIFIAKYLSENTPPFTVDASFLVAPPFDEETSPEALADFNFSSDLTGFAARGGRIHIYQSKDDDVVPFADFEKYREALPGAEFRVFEDRGHFRQETFPELVADIRALYGEV